MTLKKLCVLVGYGTRPEFIKLAPLIKLLREDDRFNCVVVNTEQHKDMLVELERLFDVSPDHRFFVMEHNQSLNHVVSTVISKSATLYDQVEPDVVLVQGDTSTVFSMATAAFNMGIKVGHIEAGLRSGNIRMPFPEEFNRRAVSLFADFHFTPTEGASNNLRNEGIDSDHIFMTGNTVVDAIQWIQGHGDSVALEKGKILITAHRRENHGAGILEICRSVKEMLSVNSEVSFVWPVHPNPNVAGMVHQELEGLERVSLKGPLEYDKLVNEIQSAELVWTDSGGIQEEVASLRKPVLILREVTERPEVVESGFGILVGVDKSKIVGESLRLLGSNKEYELMISGENPFGDGNASSRIVDILGSR